MTDQLIELSIEECETVAGGSGYISSSGRAQEESDGGGALGSGH